MNATPPPEPAPVVAAAAFEFVRLPDRIWGFEHAHFDVRLTNHSVPELTTPETLDKILWTADMWRPDGTSIRTVVVEPVAEIVPIGGTLQHTFDAWIGAFEGPQVLALGLHRKPDDDGQPVPIAIETAPVEIAIESSIREAFVELTNICNFRCTFCPQVDLQRRTNRCTTSGTARSSSASGTDSSKTSRR